MTAKKDFEHLLKYLKTIVRDKKDGILDVDLMERMGFTPPSWKTWKSKFIEKLNNYDYWYKDSKTDETKKWFRFRYLKKEKTWYCIDVTAYHE